MRLLECQVSKCTESLECKNEEVGRREGWRVGTKGIYPSGHNQAPILCPAHKVDWMKVVRAHFKRSKLKFGISSGRKIGVSLQDLEDYLAWACGTTSKGVYFGE